MGFFSGKNVAEQHVTTGWDNDAVIDFYNNDNFTVDESSISASSVTEQFDPTFYDGEKYVGGLGGINELFELDYYGLRKRSSELFHRNSYARGIIRRFVTNVINTGLHLESIPEEKIIGVPEDSLLDWAEDVENRFYLYNNTPKIIDNKKTRTGGEIQRQIYMESMIDGDCLTVLRQHHLFKLPVVEIISGGRIETPFELAMDPYVIEGVKLDKKGEHVGFYVRDDNADKGYVYIPAYGIKTGRLQAKLQYGIDKREDGVRGECLLSIAIQPLAEIDRHRDATQRKATLNSIVVAAVERDPNVKFKTQPIAGGAVRREKVDALDVNGSPTRISFNDMMPGTNYERMQPGEKVNFFQNAGVDINFGAFEAAILTGLAWALEVPPEILFLSFNKNYSASQAAINEYKIFLNKERERFGSNFLDFLYQDWFLSMVLLSKISAKGYLESMVDPMKWDVERAWTMAEWSGAIKPSTDMAKATKAYADQCDNGFNTRDRSTRELTGQKHSKVVRKLGKENENLANALRPMLELEKEFGAENVEGKIKESEDKMKSMFSELELKNAKTQSDTYGVLVRAGAQTPQEKDEEFFRKTFGMPEMSEEVKEFWKESGGFRRPITLKYDDENIDPSNSFEKEEEEEEEK